MDYEYAVILSWCYDDYLCYFWWNVATTWVQIIKAVLLLSVTFMGLMVLSHFNFSFTDLATKLLKLIKGQAIMAPGGFITDPISAISLGMALMLGTAGLPHILMRFFYSW